MTTTKLDELDHVYAWIILGGKNELDQGYAWIILGGKNELDHGYAWIILGGKNIIFKWLIDCCLMP